MSIRFPLHFQQLTHPNFNSKYLLCRGNRKHYRFVRSHRYQLFPHDSQIIWIYHKPIVDLAYHMLKLQTKTLTYITADHFQTVIAKRKNQQSSIQDPMMRFIKEHEFMIENTFLDQHPYLAYKKLCGYLAIKGYAQDRQPYSKINFSKSKLEKDIIFLPLLKRLRSKYLNTDQLKFRDLKRKSHPSPSEIQEVLNQWRDKTQLQYIQSTSSEQQKQKVQWVIENRFGEPVPVSEIVQGFGQRQYYAKWVDN